MMKRYIGWGYEPNVPAGHDADLVNCGEYPSVELARAAVADAGLALAEVETVYRGCPTIPDDTGLPAVCNRNAKTLP